MTTELEQYGVEAVGEENGQYGPGEQEVEEEYGQEAEVEGNGPQPTTPSGVRVESSLHGLVDELDKLRETLGYSNQLQAIEQHLQALQAENDELRSYAEEAIKVGVPAKFPLTRARRCRAARGGLGRGLPVWRASGQG